MPSKTSPTNKLLAALPRREYQRLIPSLEEIPLLFEEVLYEPGDSIVDVYFPTSGIVSLLAGVEDRATLELDSLVGKAWSACPYSWGLTPPLITP